MSEDVLNLLTRAQDIGKQFTCSGEEQQIFKRAFEGEAYTDMVGVRRKTRLELKRRNLNPAGFKCSNVTQKPSGKGSIYGTIRKEYPLPEHAIPVEKVEMEREKGLKNFIVCPAKMGGYGYIEGTIGKPYSYQPSQYNRGQELESKARQVSKAKRVSQAPFVSGTAPTAFFDKKLFNGTGPFSIAPKEKVKLPEIQWRPSSSNMHYAFPEYIPPNPFPAKSQIIEKLQEKVAELKKKQPERVFKPLGTSCHTHPVHSIIAKIK